MSKKSKPPETSLEAYRALHPEHLAEHYKKIIKALEILGTATAEQIAKHLTLEHVQITRRMSELEKMELVYKPGTKAATKSGRQAFNWCLKQKGQTIEKKTEKAPVGKSVSDYSKEILKKEYKQKELF